MLARERLGDLGFSESIGPRKQEVPWKSGKDKRVSRDLTNAKMLLRISTSRPLNATPYQLRPSLLHYSRTTPVGQLWKHFRLNATLVSCLISTMIAHWAEMMCRAVRDTHQTCHVHSRWPLPVLPRPAVKIIRGWMTSKSADCVETHVFPCWTTGFDSFTIVSLHVPPSRRIFFHICQAIDPTSAETEGKL